MLWRAADTALFYAMPMQLTTPDHLHDPAKLASVAAVASFRTSMQVHKRHQ